MGSLLDVFANTVLSSQNHCLPLRRLRRCLLPLNGPNPSSLSLPLLVPNPSLSSHVWLATMYRLPLSHRAKGRSNKSQLHFGQPLHMHLSMPALHHPPHLLITLFRLSLPNHPSPSLYRLLTTQSPFPFHSNDKPSPPPPSKDEYFAIVHHISHIICRDFYLEHTLRKFPIAVTSNLVYRVLRACSNALIPSFRFFAWACSCLNYAPIALEFEELIRTLSRAHLWEHMWKAAKQMKSLDLLLSLDTFSTLIHCYGCHSLADRAVEVFNWRSSDETGEDDTWLLTRHVKRMMGLGLGEGEGGREMMSLGRLTVADNGADDTGEDDGLATIEPC